MVEEARSDLRRPHPFARERVGWMAFKPAMAGNNLLLLGQSYHPVADEHYVDDETVGARIGVEAMTAAIGICHRLKCSMFHVHEHGGRGTPRFSHIDISEQPKLVFDFFAIRRGFPHGALVLSENGMAGRVWTRRSRLLTVAEFHTVGLPSGVFYAESGGAA